jgi:hypothetical protein
MRKVRCGRVKVVRDAFLFLRSSSVRLTQRGTPLPALVALLALPACLTAQDRAGTSRVSVSGTVVDRYTRRSIRNALVQLPELNLSALSDQDGRFTLRSLKPGVYQMAIRAPGYIPSEGEFTVSRPGSFDLFLTPVQGSDASTPARVTGWVTDGGSGEPLESVTVWVPSLGIRRLTDDRGWFDLGDVPPGVVVLRLSSLGYETREDSVFVPGGQTVELRISLASEPIELEGITVTAHSRFLESAGFFRRQGRGYNGRQWTAEQIEREDPVFVDDLVTEVLGVWRGRTLAGEKAFFGRRCRMSVYIDDVLMDGFDLDQLDPRNIQGMEVYHGGPSEMPVEYGWKHCGVILVWLKH